MKNINRILCPVDFSDPSRAAVEHAVDLAKHFSAQILLFHSVSEIDHPPSPSYTLTPALTDQMMQITMQMTENANNAIKELIETDIPDGISVDQHVDVGDPSTSIVQAAKEEDADLIVMSTHGRSGIKGLFFGSVAEKVVRSAECPVLTIKPKSTETNE
ncbi:universal stress protein [Desulfosarcina variabilis str. Montpellier]|uniref:universal stress protein n=1 Tax=Desulfosarcina variabilis TaxID=2300 RepID=UPI003AFB002D